MTIFRVKFNRKHFNGSLQFVGFLIAALSLYLQPTYGTLRYVQQIGIAPNIMIGGFIVSAVACLVIGWRQLPYNLLWYTAYMVYVGATWMAVKDRLINAPDAGNVPMVAATFYTMLLLYFIGDWYVEWRALNRGQSS